MWKWKWYKTKSGRIFASVLKEWLAHRVRILFIKDLAIVDLIYDDSLQAIMAYLVLYAEIREEREDYSKLNNKLTPLSTPD